MAENPNFTNPQNQIVPDYQKEEANAIAVGSRCQTLVGSKRGTVMYVGKVPELANGYWVGVKLDDPAGTNNGSI